MKFWLSGNLVRISACVVFILVACSGSVFAQTQAQTQTGRLRGQIVDATGAVIPGASITVKNSSGLVVSATSDGVGAYDVKNLAPGKYTVSVTAK
ncbi:MAG TPA: carboxypeptidase-like regulatory domain-containing protein, partial [Candidatus Angelobacter sp.]|nr:carboxypeptidase-like regulatory domain-containing protein [Candidatus Angelobacter sp.]